jgi:hypothetical protein
MLMFVASEKLVSANPKSSNIGFILPSMRLAKGDGGWETDLLTARCARDSNWR